MQFFKLYTQRLQESSTYECVCMSMCLTFYLAWTYVDLQLFSHSTQKLAIFFTARRPRQKYINEGRSKRAAIASFAWESQDYRTAYGDKLREAAAGEFCARHDGNVAGYLSTNCQRTPDGLRLAVGR